MSDRSERLGVARARREQLQDRAHCGYGEQKKCELAIYCMELAADLETIAEQLLDGTGTVQAAINELWRAAQEIANFGKTGSVIWPNLRRRVARRPIRLAASDADHSADTPPQL